MGAIDISIYSLWMAFLLLLIPVVICLKYKVPLVSALFVSTLRMSIQLVLIGIYLKYLFVWNNTLLNIAWLIVMILVAIVTVTKQSALRTTKVIIPVFGSFFFATFSILLFLNVCVIRLDNMFDARYLIVLGGMMLGNSLRGTIIGVTSFYNTIKKDKKAYLYTLALGASQKEALLPYLRQSIELALKPSLATMATMGIVALPGMMTGVILGGTAPDVAIKYQIMIMLAIITSTVLSVVLTIILTIKTCFTSYGTLAEDVFA